MQQHFVSFLTRSIGFMGALLSKRKYASVMDTGIRGAWPDYIIDSTLYQILLLKSEIHA